MSKIKILFVTASTRGGGAERQLVNIIHSLCGNERYMLRLVNTSTDSLPEDMGGAVSAVSYGLGSSKAAFGPLWREIASFKPDYVFTTSGTLVYMLVILKYLMGFVCRFRVCARVAVTPSEIYIQGVKDRLLRRVSSLIYRKADLVIAQTRFMKMDLMRRYHIPARKIRIVRNLIDKRYLQASGDAPCPKEFSHDYYNVVASGALYSVKGFDLLIEAFTRVIEKVPHARLYILGEERYEKGYREILQNMIHNPDNIFLLGQKMNPCPYYKHADLFVMSSRKEGFPNVVLESLYLGTPIVATNCVDFNGIIRNGVNGYVVSRNSIPALERGILNAIGTLPKPCQTNLENYDYGRIFV